MVPTLYLRDPVAYKKYTEYLNKREEELPLQTKVVIVFTNHRSGLFDLFEIILKTRSSRKSKCNTKFWYCMSLFSKLVIFCVFFILKIIAKVLDLIMKRMNKFSDF